MAVSFTPRSVLADVEMDEDFTEIVNQFKEEELTPDQLNLKIQGNRVIYVLNRCLAKLNILAHLPFYLQNDAELIRKYLDSSEAYFVLETMSEWGLVFNTTEIRVTKYIADYLRLGTVNKSVRKQTPSNALPEGFPNPHVYQLVDVIFYNKCLKNVIRPTKHGQIDKQVLQIIKHVQELKEVTKSRIYISGAEEKANERELRRAYKANILLSVKINDLKSQLEKQRRDLGKQLNNKVKIYETYQTKMQTVQKDFRMEMKNCLRDSEKEMMKKYLESEDRQYDLAEKAYEIVQKYENILKFNLNEEKKARSKRLKVEAQLQAWVNTFDQDIGDKQVQYDELRAEYNGTKEQLQNVERMMAEQETEYNICMAEKLAEEEVIFNEMAYQFYLHRCANMIQNFWRRYVKKRAEKKGRKK